MIAKVVSVTQHSDLLPEAFKQYFLRITPPKIFILIMKKKEVQGIAEKTL